MSSSSGIQDPNDVRGYFSSYNSFQPIARKDEVEEFDESYIVKHDGIGTPYQQFHGPIPSANEFIQTFLNFPEDLRGAYLRIRDIYGDTVVHNFAREGQEEVIHRLFTELSQVEIVECLRAQDNQSDTPLHKAVQYGNRKTAATMISAIRNSFSIGFCLTEIFNVKGDVVLNTPVLFGNEITSNSIYKMMEIFLAEEFKLKKEQKLLRTLYS
ncbi:MAG: hypothetical protein KR126chlam6_00133 [Candidatus Anoxychlamydiales bacterium]|nr:hypothetical protein [Candidatus Anoxychlamydiales bacterium]